MTRLPFLPASNGQLENPHLLTSLNHTSPGRYYYSLSGRTHTSEKAVHEARQGWERQYRQGRVPPDSADCQ
jgi:hypothetical protein